LRNAKVNILKTINVYQTQLRLSLRQLNREKSRVNSMFSALPEKEKMLRAIERQQSIKENLFILLLEKREEAALSYAVTAPSIKVVDYALTPSEPLSPKGRIVYPMSLMLGMFVPFIFLYLRFTLTNKLEGRADLAKLSPDIAVLGEIPTAKKGKEILHLADRSVMAESFRILCTNLEYHLPEKKEGRARCVLVTSSAKGEGKTTVALNLALAYAGMNKKVLLIGSDLRNPGLEPYFNPEDFSYGLSEYLSDSRVNWKECVASGLRKNSYLNICFGGKVPENPTQLLSEKRFSRFIEEAAEEYEILILDSAPCMSVADTLLISRQADATLYVTRVGYTDKNLMKYARDLNQNKQLPKMAFILNDMGSLKARKY
jgi:capsular exopolysaccharide synthesis family protein